MRKEKPRWLVRLGIVRTGLIGTGLAYALGLGVAVARPEATLAFFSQSHQEDMTVNLASDFTIRPKLIIEAPAFKRLAPTPNQKAGVKTASAAPIVLPSTYTALLGPGRTYNPSDVDTASLTLCLGSQFCGGLGIKPTTITFTDQAVRAVFSQNDLGQLLAEVKADAQVDLSLSGTTKSVGRPVVGTTTLKIIEIVPPTMTPTPTSTPTKQTPTASVTGTVIPTGTLAPTGTARPIITPTPPQSRFRLALLFPPERS